MSVNLDAELVNVRPNYQVKDDIHVVLFAKVVKGPKQMIGREITIPINVENLIMRLPHMAAIRTYRMMIKRRIDKMSEASEN